MVLVVEFPSAVEYQIKIDEIYVIYIIKGFRWAQAEIVFLLSMDCKPG